MDTDYMENLAREYNLQLRAASEDGLLHAALSIAERQLAIIEVSLATTQQPNKALAYLAGLKAASVRELRALTNASGIAAAVSTPGRTPNVFNTLVNLQTELFTDLDHIKERNVNVETVLALENRAASFLAMLK